MTSLHGRNKSAIVSPQRPTMKATGLTEQCLANLRRGRSPHKMHLLGFMSQYIQQDEQITVPQVQQLCCYDRMKKLLIKNDDTKQQKKQHQTTLLKAMQIEAKMNVLQKDLHEKVNAAKNKSNNNSTMYKVNNNSMFKSNNSYISKGNNNNSMINLGSNTNNNFNNNNSTPNNNLSMSNSNVNANTNTNSRSNTLVKKTKTLHNQYKSGMLEKLRERGYQKFFQFQRIKKETNLQRMRAMMGEQVESKFNKVMDEKDSEKRKLLQENKLLERRILQKNLQLQTLRQQNTYLKQNIKQLQQKLFGANSQIQNAYLIKSYQKWLSQYKQQFGQMSILELSRYIEQMKNSCLQKFNQVENKKDQQIMELNIINQNKYAKLKKELDKLQMRENQLIDINKNLKLNRQISQLEINQLLRSKSQLFHLREVIVSIYSQWYQKRTQNQKQLMKSLNKLKENYSYEDMLNYILFYDSKLSTNDKLNQYILKILRGIQKIRKTIYPIQSNDKLDPFLVLDQITLWVQKQIKYYQSLTSNNNNNNNNINKISNKKVVKLQLENESYLQNEITH